MADSGFYPSDDSKPPTPVKERKKHVSAMRPMALDTRQDTRRQHAQGANIDIMPNGNSPNHQLTVRDTSIRNVTSLRGAGPGNVGQTSPVPGSRPSPRDPLGRPQSPAPHRLPVPLSPATTANSYPHGYGGWSPHRQLHTPQAKEADPEERKVSQISAYVAWVNAQLKKKPGTRLVDDLKCDMQDGVALAALIEIVAGEILEDIYQSPSSAAEKVGNVDKVIEFMTQKRIRMHHTTAKDIVEGNLKAIMRLILALAAHFKPNSVKQSTHAARNTPQRTPSMAGMVQTAAVALAEARRDASTVVPRPQRPHQLAHGTRPTVAAPTIRETRVDPDCGSSGSSPASSNASLGSASARGMSESPAVSRRLYFEGAVDAGVMPKSRSQDFVPGHEQPLEDVRCSDEAIQVAIQKAAMFDALLAEHETLVVDMDTTRRVLLQLQDLLLNDQSANGAEVTGDSCLVAKGSNEAEELVIWRAKLQRSEELVREQRTEVSNLKNDCLQLQGVKAGLQQRLAEQENSFVTMKAELLRAGFCQQSLESTKTELEQKLCEKDHIVLELRRELARREREVDELQTTFHMAEREKEAATRGFKAQIGDLNDRLRHIGDTEVSLAARMASQDRNMARLEGRIVHGQHGEAPSPGRSIQSFGDDFSLVQDSLRCLRGRFHGDDPQHRTIDALEQSISSLMQRLYTTEQESRWSESGCSRRLDLGPGDPLQSPSQSRQDESEGSCTPRNGGTCTKLLYFTDTTVTPFMCSINKKLGDIRLRDIKEIIDRPGSLRYHFKAMDPEFGTVKEEMTEDDDFVPGWEGKIVAWVEEDNR